MTYLFSIFNRNPFSELWEISNQYVIPYPPGVPVIVPGEKIDKAQMQQIESLKKTGKKIIKVED